MSLFYVTGLSGAGKSAVLDDLVARGHEARGVDEDGYADWIDRVTGAVEDYAEDEPGFDFHAWYRSHNWVLSAERIAALAAEAQALGRPVFLCGVADGDRAVWHLFDNVVALVIDVPTMRRRIAGRSNVFGQSPEEMAARRDPAARPGRGRGPGRQPAAAPGPGWLAARGGLRRSQGRRAATAGRRTPPWRRSR
jgi:hypothetical protein